MRRPKSKPAARQRPQCSIEPRRPADPFGPFDEQTYGCLATGLTKTCAEVRARHFCPKFRACYRVDSATGMTVGIDWACADFWAVNLQAEQCGRLVGVQKAVETRGDRSAQLLDNLNRQSTRAIGEQARTADAVVQIAAAPPLELSAPDHHAAAGRLIAPPAQRRGGTSHQG